MRKDTKKEVVLGVVERNGRVSIPKTVFDTLDHFKVDGMGIEVLEVL